MRSASTWTLAPLLALMTTLVACGDDDGGKDPGRTDAGPVDAGAEDLGCVWHPVPLCPTGQHPVQAPPLGECEEGTWSCEDCPDPSTFPLCPFGQSHQKDPDDPLGCVSPMICDCTFTRPPSCSSGQVPARACDERGKCCYSGGCTQDCPQVPTADCGVCEEELKDERGCPTGGCRAKPCADEVSPPECSCGERPARDECGCVTGECQAEPTACTRDQAPTCPDGRVPALAGGCLTERCVTGACVDRCRQDQDCASSDVCVEYERGCHACLPKPCRDFRDCPGATDCLGGRCVVRSVAGCETSEDCDEGLVCDRLQCGACEPPCECLLDQECGAGERCQDCACVPGCRDDGGCTLPQRCDRQTGQCAECACAQDDECADGQFCDGCFCAAGCRENDECPPWQVCTEGAVQQCVPEQGCTRRADCRAGQRCVDGRCLAEPGACADGEEPCEPFFDDCSCDYVCAQAHALPDGCSRDCGQEPLPAPPMCQCGAGVCGIAACDGTTGVECPAPYHCSKRTPGYVLAEGVCREGRPEARQLCRLDTDCVPEQCCRPTLCVRSDDAGCSTPLDCESAEVRPEITGCLCDEGVCRTEYAP